ncbi:post-GPI attachment to proteins factor 3-like [Solanum pennellii]|uniref:Post-GPI attachment to proteins factor 3 n=1 Tax=Solanum pennellii TaxID=28526 RepID=A0ABM1GT46_SOLPN|nr:post-GPI attachment to proteins factor 3-like [Solanum pennellii]
MADLCWVIFFVCFSCLFRIFDASIGDIDPLYRACIVQCEKTGCAGEICLQHCKYSLDGSLLNSQKEPLYMQLNQRDCPSDCKYHCMVQREKKRSSLGFGPVKYYGKWPLKRVFGLQEPLSVAFSALNLAKNVQGCLSFFNLNKKRSYNYAALWHIYGFLSVNSCVWSVVFHSRGMEITEKLDCTSAVALLGFSLIISILRSFNINNEAARVLASSPLFAFTITHILYLNNYQMDHGWNTKVCVTMGVAQLLIWAIWAGISQHPSKSKIWTVVFGSGVAMFLENCDFPPYAGLIDAHALWHATTIPLTCIWWSFIQDDAKYQTFDLNKKQK